MYKIQTIQKKRKYDNIMNDFLYLDRTKKRTDKLKMLFNALMTISPTSTVCERVFSKSNFIKTKERNRLKCTHLNAILFLKDYFNSST